MSWTKLFGVKNLVWAGIALIALAFVLATVSVILDPSLPVFAKFRIEGLVAFGLVLFILFTIRDKKGH